MAIYYQMFTRNQNYFAIKKKIELCRDLIMKDKKDLDFVLPNIETGKFIDHTICPLCKAGKMKLYIPTLEEYLILKEKTG